MHKQKPCWGHGSYTLHFLGEQLPCRWRRSLLWSAPRAVHFGNHAPSSNVTQGFWVTNTAHQQQCPPWTSCSWRLHTRVQAAANIVTSSGVVLPQRDLKTGCKPTSSLALPCTHVRGLFGWLFFSTAKLSEESYWGTCRHNRHVVPADQHCQYHCSSLGSYLSIYILKYMFVSYIYFLSFFLVKALFWFLNYTLITFQDRTWSISRYVRNRETGSAGVRNHPLL